MCVIYFGSYLIRDRRSAFRSMVRRMLSVSESLCTIVAFRWVRFDSSNARNASCVNGAVVGGAAACSTAVGNNCRTAEFGLSALWKSVDCFLTEVVSDTSPSSSAVRSCCAWPSHISRSVLISTSVLFAFPLASIKRTDRFELSSSDVTFEVLSSH